MRKSVTITIDAEGAAFADSPAGEVTRILKKLSEKIDDDDFLLADVTGAGFFLFDSNGNRCGKANFFLEYK